LLQVPKTDATFLAAVPGTEVATCLYTKTDSTSLAVIPGTEVATCSLKLMLHPASLAAVPGAEVAI
jgi:hypothetical protein